MRTRPRWKDVGHAEALSDRVPRDPGQPPSYLASIGIPLFVQTFTSNVLSTVALGFVLMPFATRTLSFWLNPDVPLRTTIRGAVLVVALYGVLLAISAIVAL